MQSPPTRHRPAPPSAVRIGYASSSLVDLDDLTGQLGALAAAQCDQVFSEEVAPAVQARPVLAEALRAADEARLADPARPVTLTATELRRVARTTRELMELAAGLAARDVRLELLAGPLSGVFDPRGVGRLLFDVLAAAAGLDADHLRTKKLEGQRSAADEGRSSGRPRALDADMLARALQLRDEGVPVAEIAQQLTITSGKRAGQHPSVASVYRALAEVGPGAAVALAAGAAISADAPEPERSGLERATWAPEPEPVRWGRST